MAVKIRLKRLGKIRVPQYRIVVVDARKKRDGKVIEEIGKYHPKEDPSLIDVVSDRAQYWLGVGAQPTEAVQAILRVTGDWQKFKGLPGAEGRLKVAAPRRDKLEIFNEALKEAHREPSGEAVTRRSSKRSATESAAASTSSDAAAPDAAVSGDSAPDAVAPDAVAPDAAADVAARVPAEETPAGAAETAEAAADAAEGTAKAGAEKA